MNKIFLVEIEDEDLEAVVEQFVCATPERAAKAADAYLMTRAGGLQRPEMALYPPEGRRYETVDPDRANLVEQIVLGELVEVRRRMRTCGCFGPFTAYITTLEVMT